MKIPLAGPRSLAIAAAQWVFLFAIAPAPEGHGWSWRRLLDNTTFTFGIKNLADTRRPLAIDGNGGYQGYDTLAANPVQRFFYASIEKKF